MDKGYVAKKTGKMTAQVGGTNTVGIAIYYALKRFGVELTPDEVMIYMAAINIVGNAVVKFFEKFIKMKKEN